MTLSTRLSTVLSSGLSTSLSEGSAAAPASAPLDGLSAPDRAKIVHASWDGGQLFSDYAGAWTRVQRSDNDAEADCTTLASVATHCAGTTGLRHSLVDQSGLGNDIPAVSKALMSVLYEAGSPILAPNGTTLAGRLAADGQVAMHYVRNDIFGLSGTDGLQIMQRCSAHVPGGCYLYAWAFYQSDVADDWALFLEVGSESVAFNGYGVMSLRDYIAPSPYMTAWVYWGYEEGTTFYTPPAWFDMSKAAGGTSANAVVRWNGEEPPGAIKHLEMTGTYSFAGATKFAAYGFVDTDNEQTMTADALLVLNAPLSAPGQAIVDAFFASLVTP